MAGTLKQLRENISYMQNELKELSPKERSEVFRDDTEFKEFTDTLKDLYEFIGKLETTKDMRGIPGKLENFREDGDKLSEHLFMEEQLALKSARELETKKGKLLNRAIKGLTQELDDFNHALQGRDNKKDIESAMRSLNNQHEKNKLEPSAERQKIMLKSYLTDPAEQKKDIDEMNKLLKSTKSVFIKNSPYFNALEDSLKALKDFTDKLPQGQQKLNDTQTLKLTELYQNAYKAANSYINRNENYTVRGNRMNMAIRLRETLRTGAAAHMGLERRMKEEQLAAEAAKKAAEKKAAKPEKEQVPVSKLAKELEKELGKFDKAPARRNSFAKKSKQPSMAPISRQKTLGG